MAFANVCLIIIVVLLSWHLPDITSMLEKIRERLASIDSKDGR